MPDDSPLAQRSFAHGRAGLHFRRLLRHPPHKVWHALTHSAEYSAWHIGRFRITGGRGGRIEGNVGDHGFSWIGEILVWEPPSLLVYEMIAPLQAHPHGGERSLVRYEISPTGDGSLLVLHHTRLMPGTARSFAPGTHAFLDRMEAHLDGRKLPDWAARYAELEPRYAGH